MNLSDIKPTAKAVSRAVKTTTVKAVNKSTTPYLTGANLENYFIAVCTLAGMLIASKEGVKASKGNIAVLNAVSKSAVNHHTKTTGNIVNKQITKEGAKFFSARPSYDFKEVQKYLKLAKSVKVATGYKKFEVK